MMSLLNIHTHHAVKLPNVESILSLSIGYDNLELIEDHTVALGVHPWFIQTETITDDLELFKKIASHPNVKMIGECGLDKIKGAPFDQQLVVFKEQLLLAQKLNKPVLIHCVKAYDDLIALHKKVAPNLPLVIHGFNKNEQLGKQLMGQGFFLSFGKALLNENSGAALLIKEIDEFFLETDDSDHDIAEIYDAAAKLKNCSLEELKALIFANWKKLNLV